MSAKPASGGVHVKGDVSGTIINGNNNRVTTTPRRDETPEPAHEPGLAQERTPQQENTAEDHGTVFAVTDGTMHVTVNHRDGAPDGS